VVGARGQGVAIASREKTPKGRELSMLLALAIVLFIIAIAGGVIIHPIIFVLALVALVMFFTGRRGARV
jgi:hypothetical protein